MAALGVGPDTVSRVVLTHLHYDHTGNLDRFPDAELLVPARELDFWLGPLARRAQFAHAVEAGELGQVLAAVDAGRVRRLEGGEEIAEGVHAILLGGHSPGQMALGIDAQRGLGRARLRRRALLRGARARPAVRRDRRPGRDVRGLRHAARAGGRRGAHLVPGHDAEVMNRYPRVDGAAADFAVEIR